MNIRPLIETMKRQGAARLCTVLEGEGAGTFLPTEPSCELGIVQVAGRRCYVEEYVLPAKLVIIGAGHVGTAVAKLAHFVGFQVRVVDPRQELLTAERFPAETELVRCAYEDLSPALPEEAVYYLVTTSGHIGDYDSVKQLMNRPYAFLGMLGSKRKSAMVRQWLERDGFPLERIADLRSPVGLDIHAETPEEIAVSILGQMIAHRRSRTASPIPEDLLAELERPHCRGVLVTVIRKEGSTPRGPGSKLLLCQDGRLLGTVGGGIVEYQSIELARGLDTFTTRTFRSGKGEAGVMACGGVMELMFQPIAND